MTADIRDAYACKLEGWCELPSGGYAMIHVPARAYQYRIIERPERPKPFGTKGNPGVEGDAPAAADTAQEGWRSIPERKAAIPETQLDLL
jgi:hypothetical protein